MGSGFEKYKFVLMFDIVKSFRLVGLVLNTTELKVELYYSAQVQLLAIEKILLNDSYSAL